MTPENRLETTLTDELVPTKKPPSMTKVALASLMGTVIEFYDFLIYAAAAALVFSHVFFPGLGEAAGTVASFATLAVAFVARPIGAVIFGHIGDRVGRKKTLIATMTLMGSVTVLIGLLPTAETIGVAAPIILIVLRVFQGLAAGGEWAGAVLFSSEHAPSNRRGFWSMFTNLGGAIANLLALSTFFILNLTLSQDDFISWGWRIPFLIAALLLLFGMWIRLSLDETPVFEYEKAHSDHHTSLPFADAIRTQWREILLGGGALLMAFCNNYMGASYLISYGTSTLKLGATTVLAAGIVGGGVTLGIGVVLGGLLSDRFGRRKVILTANVAGCIWALVLFPLLDTGAIPLFWLGLTVSTFIAGFAFGVAGSYLSELYQTRFRYTAAALAYSLAAIFGGALPPIVGPIITAQFGSYAFSLFLSLLCLVAVICAATLKETRNRDLRHIPA